MNSFSHFFSKKFQHICVSLDVNFNESLTNNIVSFEQLGPDLEDYRIQGNRQHMISTLIALIFSMGTGER